MNIDDKTAEALAEALKDFPLEVVGDFHHVLIHVLIPTVNNMQQAEVCRRGQPVDNHGMWLSMLCFEYMQRMMLREFAEIDANEQRRYMETAKTCARLLLEQLRPLIDDLKKKHGVHDPFHGLRFEVKGGDA